MKYGSDILRVAVKEDPLWASHCAHRLFEDRWVEAEPYIMINPGAAYHYSRYVLGGRWPEAEKYIASDAKASFYYAAKVLCRSWPEGEAVLATDPYWGLNYALFVVKGRWLPIEPLILASKDAKLYSEFAGIGDFSKEQVDRQRQAE